MKHADYLFHALGIEPGDQNQLKRFAKAAGVSPAALRRLNELNRLPTGKDLEGICRAGEIAPEQLMLTLGHLDHRLLSAIRKNSEAVYQAIASDLAQEEVQRPFPKMAFETDLGELYRGDCLDLMANLESEQFDLIFADPPFNLKKLYPSKIDDSIRESKYIEWCEAWAAECARLLKDGGSLFIWNLPKWNTYIADYLSSELTFRHWIAVDIKYSLPIAGRLYPSHYSLLYFCKGDKPNTFNPDRLPMEVCPDCAADLKDYGGYKDKMNPAGINLTDVWYDIPPVRHAKYKKRKDANELSIKLLDRVIEMASKPGDVVFDPFGGAGTTYVVAELKRRKWVGVEIGPVDDIKERFANLGQDAEHLERIRSGYNAIFSNSTKEKRERRGLWTVESVREKKKKTGERDLFD